MTYFNNKNYKKSNKIIKTIITLAALTVGSILLATTVNALPSWNGSLSSGLPTFQSNGVTGYFPQSASGGVIFCNDQNSGVRSGSKDYEIYYPTVEDYNNAYNEAYINSLKNMGYQIKYERPFKEKIRTFFAAVLAILFLISLIISSICPSLGFTSIVGSSKPVGRIICSTN